ncbi:argininosuccinate lyase [Ferruginibacter yonginensis]|uniref:Argininosuccinate lyase n=1 Tax=Ferruginibacter yonginensis TaxID=1310416 RepID=A0ABV8QVR2_9BACT
MKLWQKNIDSLAAVHQFTVGNDRLLDEHLAQYDVLGSLAHIQMLQSVGLLTLQEFTLLQTALKSIYNDVTNGKFTISNDVEDVHSQIEYLLTEQLGDVGKKIHSARSRNDQVLVDLKMFYRAAIEKLVSDTQSLFQLLIKLSNQHQHHLLPGYTHLQLAMPSSFGLWFGAYAESFVDDMIALQAAYTVVNKNPLGSAAGYGSSFPINRTLTTQLLGFDDLHYNVVYAQMSRGKTERVLASAMANIAATLSKMCMDVCLFVNQQFNFISFPEQLTTGSSIMPHKKNPDVFELVRAHCNNIQALPQQVTLLTNNLPSGYQRDMQLLKMHIMPAFDQLQQCLQMMHLMLQHIEVTPNLLENEQYQYLFSVEAVNKLVLQGMPFRDAYKQIGTEIEQGAFSYSPVVHHTHEGSIGNLCNEQITAAMQQIVHKFNFDKVKIALQQLIS